MLTPEQTALLPTITVSASGDQEPQQARNLAAADFVWLCQLEGIAPPPVVDVLAALADA